MTGKTFLVNNHAFSGDLWTIDTTLRLYWQTDNTGGKENIVAPMLKLGYRMRTNLTLETEGGIELTKATSPMANYVNAVRVGSLVFFAGKGPGLPGHRLGGGGPGLAAARS